MRKVIYTAIEQALTGIVDADGKRIIRHIDLYNHQLDYAEEEQPFRTPAVLVEFGVIRWQPMPHGVREARVEVSLHVVTDSRAGRWKKVIEVFELLDTIHARLYGLRCNGRKRTMDILTLEQSVTDTDFDELRDDVETYTCHVTDRSAYRQQTTDGRTMNVKVEVESRLKQSLNGD